ncbi:uncharacterized protein LOC124694955 [Lolium rigidum]|uniref:uncharacterized protein LOC124694955 n=1 Tax=Lolium rigidum TaxID=89674 RepID=UPI001F5D9E57|nr:uncharacterized protein LOC124694955 [Lolium rigidum]
MAQAAMPPEPKLPNPCAAFRPPPPPQPPARRPGAPARPKDAPCATPAGDKGRPGQCNKAPENVVQKPSGGTYSRPEARVKLIPAEEITYVRHGKTYARTVGSDKLEKRHRRRSVTPPPSSRIVSLARSTPLPHKATAPLPPHKPTSPLAHKPTSPLAHKPMSPLAHKPTSPLAHKPTSPLAHKPTSPLAHKPMSPLSHKPTSPLSHKPTSPLAHKPTSPFAHKPTSPLAHKPTSPLAHKPTAPPPPVASCISVKRSETAENNRQVVSLKRTSPFCKVVQRGAVPPAVLRKESEMNPISPSSVHVLPAHSTKVALATKAEPSPKSVSTVDNLYSTSNQATLECQRPKRSADPIVEKELNVKLSLLSPTSVLSISSNEVCPDARSRPSSRPSLFDGKCKLASLQPEMSMPRAKCPDYTTQATCVEQSNDFEAAPSTKGHIRDEPQTNKEAYITCNMSSDAPEVLHNKLYKKPDQSKSTTQAPRVGLSNDFEAGPSSKIHIKNEPEINNEESLSCNLSTGAQAMVHTELYNKPYQPESTTAGPCVELSNDLDAVPSTKCHIRNERQTNQEGSNSCDMPSGASLILHTEPRKTCRPDACWKGKFEVTGELTHTCDELEAHFPHEIFIKVYEASKQMPEVLKLEALPLSHLLPKKFKMEPPDAHDIGLCFISSHERPNRNFDHLLEKISSHTGLRANIGITELLIFSSKLLTEDDQTKDGKLYFCGVFRKHLRKKQHPANNDTEKVECKKSGIILDSTGEEETSGINKCMPMVKAPDANATSNAAPTVSFFTGSCSPVSAGSPCKSAARTAACGGLTLDSPPGFPLDGPPPAFTSAHRMLRRGETAESQIDSCSLILDDVPPGFTSAHRGLHSTLFSEKSAIKFSLNVTRTIQTPPGLPAFSKAKDKMTATGNIHVKHDKVDVQVDDDSEERQFPKIKRLSDILGSSSASSSNNDSILSRPSNCSEVCRSAAAVPRASKFQEAGPPEVQKHCRKRGQLELSEPSGAEATKRLRVNGRIALNGSVDRRVLNGGKR